MIATVSGHAKSPAFIASALVDQEMADLTAVLDPAVDPVKLQDDDFVSLSVITMWLKIFYP